MANILIISIIIFYFNYKSDDLFYYELTFIRGYDAIDKAWIKLGTTKNTLRTFDVARRVEEIAARSIVSFDWGFA